jgi:hypothetical protein
LAFEIDATVDPTLVTGRAGVPLAIDLFRQLGVAQTVDSHVAIKQRQPGLWPAQLVESLVALWVSGGDRCHDLATLREDAALATLLGYALPAATTVRDLLEASTWSAGRCGRPAPRPRSRRTRPRWSALGRRPAPWWPPSSRPRPFPR